MLKTNFISAHSRNMKILFCGFNFISGFEYTKESLIKSTQDRWPGQFQIVQCDRTDVLDHVKDTHVIVPLMHKITKELIDQAPELKMIMQFGVGVEGVDIKHATSKGIWVCNIQSEQCGNAQSCAEHAIYLALALFRNVPEMNKSVQIGRLGIPTGKTLFKSRSLIYGFGGIGKQLLSRLLAFEGEEITVVYRTKPTDIDETLLSSKNVKFVQDKEFFNSSSIYHVDTVFLCCSQNAGNMGFVNNEFLNKLSPGVNIVNVARGGLLNYQEVALALDDGRIAGLGLDVFHTEPFPQEDPFLHHSRVIMTPHIAGVTEVSYRNMADIVADNVLRIWNGNPPIGAINNIN